MSIKITAVVENTTTFGCRNLTGEHGLSFMIETSHERVLFDTGQGMSLISNLRNMGYDPSSISKVVLSHGHYDHTGGVKALIESGAVFTLYAHPDVFGQRFSYHPDRGYLDVSFQTTRDILLQHGITFVPTTYPTVITEGITASGEIPMRESFECIDKNLLVRDDYGYSPDPITDDQCVIIDSEKGIVVILGCAHRGVINTLRRVCEITGVPTVYAIIGGTHLSQSSDEMLNGAIETLRSFEPEIVAPAHCTGLLATTALMEAFSNKAFPCNVGTSMTF